MSDAKTWAILFALSMIPYLLVAWAYQELADGGAAEFWGALGVILLVRVCFAVIEGVGGWIAWHVHGRSVLTDRILAYLRDNRFPAPQEGDRDALSYLGRIQETPEYPEALKRAAWESERALAMIEQQGIMKGMRMHAAADAAVKQYSPCLSDFARPDSSNSECKASWH